MTINSKKKGSRVELDLVHWMKERGAESARRTQQFNGKEGTSDVVVPGELPSFHIESKGTKSPTLPRNQLLAWLAQIREDCPENLLPVIFNKANPVDWIGICQCSIYHKLIALQTGNLPRVFGAVGSSVNPTQELEKANIYHSVWPETKSILQSTVGYHLNNDIFIFCHAGELLSAMLKYDLPNRPTVIQISPSECSVSWPGPQSL